MPQEVRVYAAIWQPVQRLMKSKTKAENMILNMIVPIHNTHKQQDACRDAGVLLFILMSQLSLEDICLSFCRDTALEILALRMFRERETAQFARKRASARRRLSALSHDKNPAHLFFKI